VARRVLIPVTLLLAGVVVTLLVAWTCMVTAEIPPGAYDPVTFPGGAPAEMTAWLADPDMPVNDYGSIYAGPGWRFTVIGVGEPPGVLQRSEAGWPMIAVEAKARTKLRPMRRDRAFELAEAVGVVRPPAAWSFPGGVLPAAPRWTGLAVDALVYAALLGAILFGVPALRRRMRVRRGLCAACRYPVGDSSVCTECGRPVRRRVRDTDPTPPGA
jgi:hypothetical protein